MRTALLLSVASLALVSAPVAAADILYASSGSQASSQTVADGGVTQIQMNNGAVISIVGPAEFSLDGEVLTIANGGVTIAGGPDAPVTIQLPGDASTVVAGSGSLTIKNGEMTGNVMNGQMTVRTGAQERRYRQGQNWWAREGARTSMVMANAAQATPGNSLGQSVIRTAAQGRPVTLGAALQSVGASGDVIAASANIAAFQANPALQSLPSGDVATLLGFSDQLAAALGGASFNGASPALINTYLQFLANDGQIGTFQAAYAQLISQYLTLLANGSFGSDFTGADLTGLNAYLAYLQNTNGLGQVAAGQQALLDAYLQFLTSGGAPGNFVAPAALLNEEALAAYVAAINGYAQFLAAGGNPAEFGTSAAIIEAYLRSIAGSGLLEQLFGAQSLALNAYLEFLANGGVPAEFTGFDPDNVPALNDALAAQYVAAIQAYVAFLQGGGAPADFQGGANLITTYLTVLQNAGLFTDLLGAQASTLQAYLDFLATGGAPGDFNFGISNTLAQQYATAIQAYLDFIANGGVPSEFAGLPANVFQAYLEALANAGLFDTLLADDADFLTAYLAFLRNGGDIDDFGGLPGVFEFPVPQGRLAANNFIAFRGSQQEFAPFRGQIDRSRSNVIYDEATGAPLYFDLGSTRVAIGDAELIEAGKISENGVSWGRWVNGTAYAQAATELPLGANGLHVIAGPMVTNMPTTGLIEYDFVGGTNPTLTGGEVGSLRLAKAAISYGSTTRVGAELVTDFADRSYTLRTLGGIAATATNGIALRQDLAPGFFFGEVNQTTGGKIEVIGTGAACASGCSGEIRGYISGDAGAELAVSYIARDAGGVEVLGTAGFAKGDALDLSGGAIEPQAGTVLPGVAVYVAHQLGSTLGREAVSGPLVYANEAGQIVGYDIAETANEQINAGSTTLVDTGSAAGGDVRWSRFTNGTLVGEYFGFDLDVGANAGFHILAGVPTANLPGTGIVQYDFVGGTKPTAASGAFSPGTFTGQAAVAWGSEARLGLDAIVAIGADSYDISTTGGITDPTQSDVRVLNFVEPLISGFYAITSSGAACPAGDCGVSMTGGVFGDDAAALGFIYNIAGSNGDAVSGAAVFAKADAGSPQSSGPGDVANQFVAYIDRATVGVDTRAASVTYDSATGAPVYYNAGSREFVGLGSATLKDAGSSGSSGSYLGWGRWTDGTTSGDYYGNQLTLNGEGFHVIGGDLSANLPTTGHILFDSVGGTRAIRSNGVVGSVATGQAVVAFGAQNRVAVDFDVAVDGLDYRVLTPGGLHDVDTNGLAIQTFGNQRDGFGGTADVYGTVCDAGCNANLRGFLGGDGGSTIGLVYRIFEGLASNQRVEGSIGFGATGAFTPDAGQVVAPPAVSNEAGTVDNSGVDVTGQMVFFSRGGTSGISSSPNDTVTFGSQTDAPIAESGFQLDIGTAKVAESDRVTDVIGWGRWVSGTGSQFNGEFALEGSQSLHILAGTPATNIPASGTVTYDLVSASTPTASDGSVSGGTFDGSLGVAFGADTRVGIDFDVGIGGVSYAINTPGGAADPMNGGLAAFSSNGVLRFGDVVAMDSTGPVCAGGNGCRASVSGFLAGNGASHAGVLYTFGAIGETDNVVGTAIFGANLP